MNEEVFYNNNQSDRIVLSLVEVLNALSEGVRQQFPTSFWMKCEISKVNLYPYSGHAYPEIVQKKNQTIVAQTKAIIWENDFNRINQKLIATTGEQLKDGMSITCLAKMNFHPLYGLSLIITDIDPDMVLGQLEKERLDCIAQLKKYGVLNLNSTMPMEELPQRLAVISVPSSKGFSDFVQTLEAKKDKYKFFIKLFPSLLQGDKAATSIIDALKSIEVVKEYFDCVLIIRGGGGDVGLTCYNDFELCSAIAHFPLPVLTGIGHSTNVTVAEMVAYKNFITPTALAEFFLDKFESFDNSLNDIIQKISKVSHLILKEEDKTISYAQNIISMNAKNIIDKAKNDIKNDEKYLQAINPINILKKGYSITLIDGRIINTINLISENKKIETILFDGRFTSTIDKA